MIQRIKAWLTRPSSWELWIEERRQHYAWCEAFRAGREDAEWEALRKMAACRDELDRRGVTHL